MTFSSNSFPGWVTNPPPSPPPSDQRIAWNDQWPRLGSVPIKVHWTPFKLNFSSPDERHGPWWQVAQWPEHLNVWAKTGKLEPDRIWGNAKWAQLTSFLLLSPRLALHDLVWQNAPPREIAKANQGIEGVSVHDARLSTLYSAVYISWASHLMLHRTSPN